MSIGAYTGEAFPQGRAEAARPADAASEGPATTTAPRAKGRRLSTFNAGAAALTAMALISALPLHFTATADLTFDTAIQPPAAAIRGIGQVLGSRELARDAIDRLLPREVARLASDSLFAPSAAAADRPTLTEQAARRVVQDLAITPTNGGRGYQISVSTASPALAARLADAYAEAALDLNTRPAGESAAHLPTLSRASVPARPLLPDLPGALPFTLLAAACATFFLGRMERRREPLPQGLLDRSALPQQLDTPHRITWLDGPAPQGLELDEAVAQILPHAVALPQATTGARGRLILITSDGLPEAAGLCARAVARRLGDDAGAVLVVLDQARDGAALLELGCEASDPGVRDLLVGRARFGETLHRDPHSRAHVIPPGHLPPGWTSATGAPNAEAGDSTDAAGLAGLLDALRQTYDFVVVANPPLMPTNAAFAPCDPLVVCLTADSAPPTAAVESFDALAGMRFARIVMVRYATGEAVAEPPVEELLPPEPAPAEPAQRQPAARRPNQDAPLEGLRGAA